MNNKYLNRISFKSKDQMMIDESIAGKARSVQIIKENNETHYIMNGKKFTDDSKLFECIDEEKELTDESKIQEDELAEMTDTGGVGGGYEMPLAHPKDGMVHRKWGPPYTDGVVNIYEIEKLVKAALVEEFVHHNAYNLTEKYREINKKNAEQNQNNVEGGIKIIYGAMLPPVIQNYDLPKNDYNGDGIPDRYKENETLLDLMFTAGAVSEKFKDWAKSQMQIKATGNTLDTNSGEEIVKAAQRKAELKDSNPANSPMIQVGSDIEFAPESYKDDAKKETYHKDGLAIKENTQKEKIMTEGHMYRFSFNDQNFSEDRDALMKLIPSKVRQEGMIFEMKDSEGNLLKLIWEDDTATILEERNLLNEQIANDRREKLFGFNHPTNFNSKLQESDIFKNTFKTLKSQINEDSNI